MEFLKLFNKISPLKIGSKSDQFNGWIKCDQCEEMLHSKEVQQNLNCCPKCDHHFRLSGKERIKLLADHGTFEELYTDLKPIDPLNFVDSEPYKDRIKRAQKKSGRNEAALVGTCTLEGRKIALGVLDFSFMGGSMGSVVGEKFTRLMELALSAKLPLILVSASGGARMQESIFSLMQMAKTSAALSRLHQAGIPYISVLTNPTTGGVTASYASLGDIIIAEPKALIGFAGPRVVEQTIRQKLPDTAQKSEFLLEKGMIDCIVKRSELKYKLHTFLEFLSDNQPDERDDSKKLDELIAQSQKNRKKNQIKVVDSCKKKSKSR